MLLMQLADAFMSVIITLNCDYFESVASSYLFKIGFDHNSFNLFKGEQNTN